MKNSIFHGFLTLSTIFLFSINILAQEYQLRPILEAPQTFQLKHGLFYSCSDKVAIPFELPQDAIGFYYEFIIQSANEQTRATENLEELLTPLLSSNKLGEIPPDIMPPTSETYANTYLIEHWENAERFEKCDYKKYPLGGATHQQSAVGYFENPGFEKLFVGFENPYGNLSKIKITVNLIGVYSISPN